MIIAIPYDNGNVFGHFGKSEVFKLYTITGGEVKRSEIRATEGAGHAELVPFLKNEGVNVVICGGIGERAIAALNEAGIEVYPGIHGSCDEAADALAKDTLEKNEGAACSHHENHDHGNSCHAKH